MDTGYTVDVKENNEVVYTSPLEDELIVDEDNE